MRIGIIISGQSPESGGGFTFEQQIISALLSNIEEWPHEWLFIGYDREPPIRLPSSKKCSYVSLHSEPRQRIENKLRDWSDRGRHAGRHRSSIPPVSVWQRAASSRFRERGGEMIWSLVPSDTPFDAGHLRTVWDLQHRLQPIFPEVTANGEWERREAMYMRTLPRAVGVVVGTERGRAEVSEFYRIPTERIHVVPLPTPHLPQVDPSVDESILRQHGLSSGYLYYPAQFWAHKNHVNLLLALRQLHDNGRQLHVVFSGSDQGVQHHVEAETRRLRLEAFVHFVGFVPQRELPTFYRHAKALCFPSFFGPDNLPPLEAMSLGCPVLTADVPGAIEQLGDAAIRFDPTDPSAIAAVVMRLLDEDGLADTLRKRGLHKAVSWQPKNYVAAISDIFSSLEPIRRCWP